MHKSLTTKLVSFAHNTSHKTTENFLIHTHSLYELYYFISGDADYLVDGKEYRLRPHTLILLAPNVFHGIRVHSKAVYERYSLHFDPNVLSVERRHMLLGVFPKTGGQNIDSKPCYWEHMQHSGILELFRSFEACADQEVEIQKAISPVLTEALLATLLLSVQPLSLIVPEEERGRVSHATQDIILYLNEHFTEPITLDMLSERFYISKHYLNRAFRKATGTTVMDYLIHKRVTYVQQLLINGISAVQAASLAGFNDYTSFYRAYVKRFGHAPSRDRAATKNELHGAFKANQSIRRFLMDRERNGALEDNWEDDDENIENALQKEEETIWQHFSSTPHTPQEPSSLEEK